MALSQLRLRLAAGFALAFGTGLTLLALGLLGFLWRESHRRLDARLSAVALGVADAMKREVLETPDSALAFAAREVRDEWPRTGDHWVIVDATDQLLATTDTAGDLAPLLHSAAAAATPHFLVPVAGSDLRVTTTSSEVATGAIPTRAFRVLAFSSTSGIEEDTEVLAMGLALAAPIILLLSLVCGYALAGRALRPVKDLGTAIAAIAPSDLSRRLHLTGAGDEVAALSLEFNRLLARLDAAQQRNRQFVREAAHQIRTPLTLVLGEAELERLAHETTPEQRRLTLQRIRTAAQQMRRRVDELFLLAEAEAGTRIPLDDDVELDGLVLECTDLMRARAAAAGRSLALGSVEAVTVRGNSELLREAVLELLENACRHGGPSAPVTTEVQRIDGWALLTVSNAISREVVVDAGGRQLGLPIVTWIAEGHGGRLERAPGEGAYRSRLWLPGKA